MTQGARHLRTPGGGRKPALWLATSSGGTAIPCELFELFPVLERMIGRRGGVIRMMADRGTVAVVLVDQHCGFAAELSDQYLRNAAGTANEMSRKTFTEWLKLLRDLAREMRLGSAAAR